jgi:ketosteroid isomerase-like protein
VSENLDLVRSIYADWERGDYSRSDWAHPEIEFVFAEGPTPGTWRGVAGMTNAWRDFLSAWEDARPEAESYRELDDGRVMVLANRKARGKSSGLDVEQLSDKGADLFHLRDSQVTKLVSYFDRDRALADLDLKE